MMRKGLMVSGAQGDGLMVNEVLRNCPGSALGTELASTIEEMMRDGLMDEQQAEMVMKQFDESMGLGLRFMMQKCGRYEDTQGKRYTAREVVPAKRAVMEAEIRSMNIVQGKAQFLLGNVVLCSSMSGIMKMDEAAMICNLKETKTE